MRAFLEKFKENVSLNNIMQNDSIRYMGANSMLVITVAISIATVMYYTATTIHKKSKETVIEDLLSASIMDDVQYIGTAVNCLYVIDINTNTIVFDNNTDGRDTLSMHGWGHTIVRHHGFEYVINNNDIIGVVLLGAFVATVIVFVGMAVLLWGVLFQERMTFLEELSNKEINLQHDILESVIKSIDHNARNHLYVLRSVLVEIEPIIKLNNENYVLFDVCGEALGQLEQTLLAIRGYRGLANSTQKKTVYDAIDTFTKMISFIHAGWKVTSIIDPRLKLYYPNNDVGFTTQVLMTVVMNHVNNSIESGAGKVVFVLGSEGSKYIDITISDDGDGVPPGIVDTLYTENITAGKDTGASRGLGLYLNRHLLRNTYGGDDYLVSTTTGAGAVFCIRIPVEDTNTQPVV